MNLLRELMPATPTVSGYDVCEHFYIQTVLVKQKGLLMQVKVHSIRTVNNGLLIARVQAGSYFGDVPAAPGTKEGHALLDLELKVKQGRLEARLKVKPMD